jgi:dynein heavy chain
LDRDRPRQYWLTGFFNPQGFLTAVRQEVTRAHIKEGWSLDNVETKTEVTSKDKADVDRAPPEGVYIYGLYLEGASWDRSKGKLKESASKEMFKQMPILHVTATEGAARGQGKAKEVLNRYKCPCYKYPHRSNAHFVLDVDLPCDEEPSHWVLRGVALLCTTD